MADCRILGNLKVGISLGVIFVYAIASPALVRTRLSWAEEEEVEKFQL